ncbi:MAG: hypothetical protein KDC92_10095 [Bacteroidetes bacterium]|nr:hypothetical protein [Bacteroidota bacterium]
MKEILILLILVSCGVRQNPSNENDCIFDHATQTDGFVRDVSKFKNYTWVDSIKTAFIRLENGDSIIASRGGCAHFGVSAKWTHKTNSEQVGKDYVLKQSKWLANRIYNETDYVHFTSKVDSAFSQMA